MTSTTNKTDDKLRQIIKENGWKQGSLLYVNESDTIINQCDLKKYGLFIIITHSCDLLHSSIEVEPTAEMLFLKKIRSMETIYTRGYNPRKLHLSIEHSDITTYYECSIIDRHEISRDILTKIFPSKEYTIPTKYLLNASSNGYQNVIIEKHFQMHLTNESIILRRKYGN